MEKFMFAVVAMLVLILVSRWLNERAMKKLSVEEKARLIDLFSSQRVWNFGLIILMLVGYYTVIVMKLVEQELGLSIYFVVLLGFMIFSALRSRSLLINAGFDEAYQHSFLISTGLRLLSILVFLVVLFL